MEIDFSDFCVGDRVVFEVQFSDEDFKAFSRLSADTNRLHHDEAFALQSGYGRPIVPMHLVIAPLSSIAGMHFPGLPSLYLGHEVRAIAPVYYGENIRYCARIQAINRHHRVFVVRVLCLRGVDIVLDATLRVQSRLSHWRAEEDNLVKRSSALKTALITGASGDIGRACAVRFAADGWNLLLVDRGNSDRRAQLEAALTGSGVTIEHCTVDLMDQSARSELADKLEAASDIATVVHTASPPIDSPLMNLVEVNYAALKDIARAVLPQMLEMQNGSVVFVGSAAMMKEIAEWDDYASAKSMATSWLARFDHKYSAYGVRGMTIAPGFVNTRFSQSVRGDAPSLLPEDVASSILTMVRDRSAALRLQDVHHTTDGDYGFHAVGESGRAARSLDNAGIAVQTASSPSEIPGGFDRDAITDDVATLICKTLRLPPDYDLTGGGLGITPNWDSLAQIELMLAIEAGLQIGFDSSEFEGLTTYERLIDACRVKV